MNWHNISFLQQNYNSGRSSKFKRFASAHRLRDRTDHAPVLGKPLCRSGNPGFRLDRHRRDPRSALAAAFARFSKDTGAGIVAEGVETESETNALRELGVSTIQGFYVARPMKLDMAAGCAEGARPTRCGIECIGPAGGKQAENRASRRSNHLSIRDGSTG